MYVDRPGFKKDAMWSDRNSVTRDGMMPVKRHDKHGLLPGKLRKKR
jgi:hypothetical protein